MSKAKGFTSSKLKKPYFPFVSVCTPTFNRRPFIPMMLDCFRNQDYPKDRIEWIIVDDGTDKIKDLIDVANIPQIKYYQPSKRMNLGEKRNYMHTLAKGSIIVYMDDDDYYPPERVSHAVETLMNNKSAMCAGSSELYIYFKHISKMIQCGPYGPNHATAGTFAFRSTLLDSTKYENHAALAEERAFLKDYTVPFVQLDPLKTILVFSHIHNTFDKKRLLENPHPDFLKESPKTIDMFIKNANESHIKNFFLNDIDDLLAMYEPGHPKMKPEVLAQTKQIEEQRKQEYEKAMLAQQPNRNALFNSPVQNTTYNNTPQNPPPPENITIMLKEEGKDPVPMTMQQVVELLQQLQNGNNALTSENMNLKRKVNDLEESVRQMQQLLISKNNHPGSSSSVQPRNNNMSYNPISNNTPYIVSPTKLKSDPEINIRA
jgi:glycosyltransferase involved in cell wall biosynthesis